MTNKLIPCSSPTTPFVLLNIDGLLYQTRISEYGRLLYRSFERHKASLPTHGQPFSEAHIRTQQAHLTSHSSGCKIQMKRDQRGIADSITHIRSMMFSHLLEAHSRLPSHTLEDDMHTKNPLPVKTGDVVQHGSIMPHNCHDSLHPSIHPPLPTYMTSRLAAQTGPTNDKDTLGRGT